MKDVIIEVKQSSILQVDNRILMALQCFFEIKIKQHSIDFSINTFTQYYQNLIKLIIKYIHQNHKSQLMVSLLHFSIILFIITFLLYFGAKKKYQIEQKKLDEKKCVMIILGSGGHTTEMCEMLRNFTFKACGKVTVLTGDSDTLSESFFMRYFNEHLGDSISQINLTFLKTKRTNKVSQSKITSVFTTLYAFLYAFYLIIGKNLYTTHLIANGPGICVPFFTIFKVLNMLQITKTRLIFVQSWCRVTSISLAGKIVKPLSDQFITHWETKNPDKKIKYYGKII